MRRHSLLSALALLASCALPADAQSAGGPIRFARLSMKQGLSQSTVLCTFQDSRGFMWFCTEDGLNRYDGYSFVVYRHDPAQPGSLPNNFVRDVAEDEAGHLWVATEGGGVARWDPATDLFASYRHRPADSATLASDFVRRLRIDRQGFVWAGTRSEGLDRLDPATGRVTHYRHDPANPGSLSDDNVAALLEDKSGTLWVGTNAGLNRLDPGRERFMRYRHDPAQAGSLSDDQVRSLLEDRAGALWVGTQAGGLNRLLPNGSFQRLGHGPADPHGLSHAFARAMLADNEGRLWVGTPAGLDLLDPMSGRFVHYRNDASDPGSLSDHDVMSLHQDRGGVLWVGTRSGGVNRWNPRTWSLGYQRAQPGGLSHNYVTAFAVGPQGRLWVGTLGGGLNVLDRRTGEWTQHRQSRQPHALPDDRVMALRFDHRGALWVGTMGGGLSRFDQATGRFRTFRHDPARPDSLSSNGVMTLFEDSRGALWIGTFRGGLNRFDPRTETFVRYRHDSSDPRTLGGDIVTTLAEGPAGVLWVGTNGGGLTRLVPDTGELARVRHDAADPTSLPTDTVYALHADATGTLWVGTRGGGLSALRRFEAATGRAHFQHYGERAGLPNSVVYSVLPDNRGHLWLATNNGLSTFDPRAGTFHTYTESHGLQGNEFTFGAHYRSPAGELFFGGPNGFNAFVPEQMQKNEQPPAVALTGYLKLNRPVTGEGPLHQLKSIQIGHRDQVVTFEFAALDYTAPESNRYRYKLEGFDADWVDVGPVRRVTYTNLEPGRYVLRARAANGDGVWGEQGLAVALNVLPPPWRTWWAYVGYAAIALAGVVALLRGLRRKAAREANYRQRLETEVESRTRELQDRNTDLAALNQKLLETSLTDSLTGLRNRRFLFEEASKDLALIDRRRLNAEGDPEQAGNAIFIMVDLDWFKPINDTCGHAAGDRVLLQVREVLEKACRRSDVLIRWGGDEFLVVGRDQDLEGIEILPERIRAMIEQTSFELGDGRVAHLTCSLGFTCYPATASDQLTALSLEQVVGLADSALYMAKKGGRNAWVGLLATEVTSAEDVIESIHRDPQQVAERGRLGIVSSRAESPGGAAWPQGESRPQGASGHAPRGTVESA